MLGLAFIFVPQNVLAYVGVPREKNNQISSMNSFMRNMGGSIGIALISSSISRIGQQRRGSLAAHTALGSAAFENMTNGLAGTLQMRGAGRLEAMQKAHGMISLLIERQATTLAYVDVISMLALIVLGLVPFLLIMKRNKPAVGEQAVFH
jgi:DHA2 family multidrug resistance protein